MGYKGHRIRYGQLQLALFRSAATLAVLLLALTSCAEPTSTPSPATAPPETPLPATATPNAPTNTPTPETQPLPDPYVPRIDEDIPDAPERDNFDLARRLLNVEASPLPVSQLYADEKPGFTRAFWGINLDMETTFEFEATVRHVSNSAVWYFPTGVAITETDLASVVNEFEGHILPGILDTFAPGMTLPGKIGIVHGPFVGVGGYFSGNDSFPSSVAPISNERISLYMNDDIAPGSRNYLGILAHELHHLVHWSVDPTEDAWIHEGFSEFGVRALNYVGIPAYLYFERLGASLTNWPTHTENPFANYAGASLFVSYIAQRIGLERIAEITAQPANGQAGVQAVLDLAEPGTGFEDFFTDWLVANIAAAPEPPYGYASMRRPAPVNRVARNPGSIRGEADQFGAWYLDIEPAVPLQVTFTGNSTAPRLPVAPFSGDACWWSNRGNAIDATLTRSIDLTAVETATLEFRAWWDIEPFFDHGYVTLSEDDGATWRILEGTLTSADDPFRSAFGPSYTGTSRGWQREQIDLTPFTGQQVLLRFEYVTDEAVTTPGWCIDDIAIPEIELFDDAESPGSWDADGFVLADSVGASQRFAIRLVEGSGNSVSVTPVHLSADGSAAFDVNRPMTLVVAAFASKTSEPASFELDFSAAAATDNP